MKIHFKHHLFLFLLLLLCISTSGCSFLSSTISSTEAMKPQSSSVSSSYSVADASLDAMVKQTLDDINRYGWGSTGKYGTGIWINWYRNNPTAHQNSTHDGQNDLRAYENMVWYEARHPRDTSFKADIDRLLPIVTKEWARSTSPKGWLYFLFQRLAQYADTAVWTKTMKTWANAVYKGIDPAVGVSHGSLVDSTAKDAPVCPDGYRVDQNLENGLALIDAGKRFGHEAWIQAGAREVSVVTKQAFVSKYHLFSRTVCQGQIWDWESKGGEIGQETDALLKVGAYTHNATYLDLAKEILDTVVDPATGLRNLKDNGIYFKIMLNTGRVDRSRKEIRQLHMLQSFHEANAIFNNRYANFEANLLFVAKHSFFPAPVAGWMYEVNNDYSLYKGSENWISMESCGIAMESLQTVLGS